MIKDYRIQEISDRTELTKNYVYTCLKKMPDIFKKSVSTGQHNSKIFSQEALDIFIEIASLKKDRMWSILQIRNYLESSRSKKSNQPQEKREKNSQACDYMNNNEVFSDNTGSAYNIPTQTLIEQIFSLKEEIASLEKINLTLRSNLQEKDRETRAQRKMSDQIIFELTSHISKLSSALSDSNSLKRFSRRGEESVDEPEKTIEIPETACPDMNLEAAKRETRTEVLERLKNELEISTGLISKIKENDSNSTKRSADPDEVTNPVKRGDRS